MLPHGQSQAGRKRSIHIVDVQFAKVSAVHRAGTRRLRYPLMRAVFRPPRLRHYPMDVRYRSAGSMISAKEFLALFRRDFTVPKLQCVISAISS